MSALAWAVLAAMAVSAGIRFWAGLLNLRSLRPDAPAETPEIDAAAYARLTAYLRQAGRLGLAEIGWDFFLAAAFLVFGGFGFLDALARGLGLGVPASGLVYLGFLALAADVASRPFSIYRTFVLDARFGLNRTTPGVYLADMAKGYLLAAVIGGALVWAGLALFSTYGPSAWVLVLIVILVATVALQYVAPVWILPLFFRFAPLPEGPLRQAVADYVRGQGFEPQGLFVLDGSRRSTRANAFFAGFGKKRRIGLYDTLIERLAQDEAVAVLAHEVGHAKLGHLRGAMAISLAQMAVLLFLLSLFLASPAVPLAVGAAPGALYVSVAVFGLLVSPVTLALGIAANASSRRNEFAADAFAARTTGRPQALAAALRKIAAANLANLRPHPLTVLLYGTHPPLLARLARLAKPATEHP